MKGNICYSNSNRELCIVENGYVVSEDGICKGVYEVLPEMYQMLPLCDYTDKLIIPGFTDLHVHAPQYSFRGLGMDLELLEWLNTHTFVEEAKYKEMAYAKKAYKIFVEDLKKSATTRACIFGTIHNEATLFLMEELEKAGIKGYVGKVNMDRNSPDDLCESSASQSIKNTEEWIKATDEFINIHPILTPRFIPTCSDELMQGLSYLQKKYNLAVQSHLSENFGEIEWVKELCPDADFYGQAYNKYGMFGNNCPTIMAHCVHSTDKEIQMMKNQGVFVAHCPESNTNLSSGVAPIRRYLDMGLKVGLGSDVAAGSTLSMFKTMSMAIQCSKLRWRLYDNKLRPLNIEEVFYLATRGGGEFFGKVGAFEEGFEFEAVVLDDSNLRHPQMLSVKDRLERMIYLADDRNVIAKFIDGLNILEE